MPTPKQQKALAIAVENGGNISRAMLEAGYSPATAKTPQKLTESAGWKELAATFLDEESLAEKHAQLLNATSLERLNFDETTSDEVIEEVVNQMPGYKLLHIVENKSKDGAIWSKYAYVQAPDNQAQDKALDKAYKLKGSYAAEKHLSVNMNLEGKKDDPALLELKEEYEAKLLDRLRGS